MHNTRILFVDDEANILSGLRRMLRSMRNLWDMRFVRDPKEAAEMVVREHFDVVVTDMRMPGMTGAQLLEEVSRVSPSTVRMILSGYSDKEMSMNTVPVAHQFLAKPASPDTVIGVIERAMALRDLLRNKALLDLVSRIKALPALPDVYVNLVRKLGTESTTPEEIGDIISHDVGMSAKILQLVNSAFFGLVRRVESLEQAVVYLGVDTIRSLVLGVHIFDRMRRLKVDGVSMQEVVDHSLGVGELAKSLAARENKDKERRELAFFAGLVHDCGILLLAQNLPERYEKAVHAAVREDVPLYMAEADEFGVSHAEVGAYLLNLWGLPEKLVNAVAFHHNPMAAYKPYMDTLAVVHVADYLEFVKHRSHVIGALTEPEEDYLQAIGKEGCLSEWKRALLGGADA